MGEEVKQPAGVGCICTDAGRSVAFLVFHRSVVRHLCVGLLLWLGMAGGAHDNTSVHEGCLQV